MAQINIPGTGLWQAIADALNSMFSSLFGRTGWADYADTQYTEGAPFSIVADVPTLLPNNAGNTVDFQKPTYITTFYDGLGITGRNGDSFEITFDLKAKPTNVGTTEVQLYIDITGGAGTPANLAKLYNRLETFDKGVGVEKSITYTIAVYSLATWEANGGVIYALANGSCDLYDIRYVITSSHKAR